MFKKYPVFVSREGSGAWFVTFADAPINIVRPTLEEALAECQEAFAFGFDDEEALPSPTSLEDAIRSPQGQEADAIVLVDIDTAFFDDPTERRNTSAKRSQWEAITLAARKAGKTRSAFIVDAALDRARELMRR